MKSARRIGCWTVAALIVALGTLVVLFSPVNQERGGNVNFFAADVAVEPSAPALRVRRVHKAGRDWWMLFNEEGATLTGNVQLQAQGPFLQVDPWTGHIQPWQNGAPIVLDGYQLTIVCADGPDDS